MKINRTKLKNGANLTAINMPDTLTITLLIMLKSGPRFDPINKEGLSHFVEHLMMDWSDKLSDKNEILRILESEGIVTGAFSYQETNIYWMRGMKTSLSLMSKILINQIQNPLFRIEDIKTEKQIVLEEWKIVNDNPESIIWENWAKNVWQGSSLGRSYIGDKKTIKNFTRRYVLNYFKSYYLPINMEYVVCGDILVDDAALIIENNLEIKEKKIKPKILPIVVKRTNPINITYKKTNGLTVAYGFLTTMMSDDSVVLELIENILGGGWSSLLRQKIAQKGLTYSIECYSRNLSDTGYLMNMFTCDKKNLNRIISVINSQLKLIKCGKLEQSIIDRAKGYFKGSIILNNEKSDDLANWFAYQQIANPKNVLSLSEKCEKIQNITNEEIVRVASKYFTNKNWYLSVIGLLEERDIKVNVE